jgi:hypothetical protein
MSTYSCRYALLLRYVTLGPSACIFHLPKPLHGWRQFAGEVGIIVVGVLIALGAEQLVEEWRWHERVRTSLDSLCRAHHLPLGKLEPAMPGHIK